LVAGLAAPAQTNTSTSTNDNGGLNAGNGPATFTFTNKDGIVISNAEVVKIYANKLIWRKDFGMEGAGTVKLADLPPDLQQRFGYDPEKAAALDEKEQQDRAADLQRRRTIAAAQEKYSRLKAKLVQGSRRVDGKVLQKISEGLLVESGDLERALQEHNERVYGDTGGVTFESGIPGGEALGLVLLVDYPDPNMTDEGHVDIIAYPLGLFSYDTLNKSSKTVRKFSADLETAIRTLALEEQLK
jgi:hypothetical protein